jgi:hypothetical protein
MADDGDQLSALVLSNPTFYQKVNQVASKCSRRIMAFYNEKLSGNDTCGKITMDKPDASDYPSLMHAHVLIPKAQLSVSCLAVSSNEGLISEEYMSYKIETWVK